MRSSRQVGELFTFGGRVPATVGALITATVVASLVAALDRTAAGGRGLLGFAALIPQYVWEGQVWRLVTWVFFERDPLSLLFGALTLYWFGRDLCYAWGSRRFIITFFVLSAAAAGITCLVAKTLWPALLAGAWTGSWPVILALTVAWAIIFPDRQILLMMALPISGRAMLWVTLGGTLLYAAFFGLGAFVPHLTAQLLMLAYVRGWSLRGMWQTLRIRGYERRARRRASHLKVVNKDRWMN